MRKKWVLACLLAILMVMVCSAAFAESCMVSATKLILREEPNSTSKALQTLPQGTMLDIVKKEGHWYQVTYGKFTGYVYDLYVTLDGTIKDDGILQKGEKGDAVKAVQQRLKELGYYKSTCDGSYGDVTVLAVKAFQKKNGLPQDGVAGESTQKKLYASTAIGANDKTDSSKDDGTLKEGSKGAAVKALQQRLKDLGYYNYTCDSSYGYRTVEAVKAFQKRNSLTANGIADAATQKKLNSTSAVPAKDAATEAPKDNTLKEGAKGEAVKQLQQRLKDLGYYNYTCDSSYGYRTVEAVKAFQKRNGLTVDGVAGEATLKKLNSSSAVPAKDEPTTPPKDDDGTLKVGSKGDAVKKVQQRLKELGYYSYGCDGDFGERTATAVKAFQKMNGLTQDGVVGATTLTKLNS
ncbi:MAG: peptidoglycan-binding protein, partial [Clostridiales bacterium]|nr:peptidoglycan-binding protein [Clostridiales bacterium]